jgi:phosphatidylinositol alpha-1,6-mannosyltransferase
MRHLLVTNDFPPKIGGIQSYLWELWRRLPAESTTVLTTAFEGDRAWDAAQPFRVERAPWPVLLPVPQVIELVNRLAREVDAGLVLLDPAFPLGAIGPRLERPFGLVLHGAEVTIPARLPVVQLAQRWALRHAALVVAAGGYPADEGRRAAGRAIPTVIVPPGVDTQRFHPLDEQGRREAREHVGLDPDSLLVVSVSRLVRRKGMDVLIRAVASLAERRPALHLAIAGDGRDRGRLEEVASTTGAPVTFLGRVPDEDLPALYGCGDVFAMLCHDRWGGLEQEGFGIVFLESAAAGVAQLAGRSGGSAEAVEQGSTGVVVEYPRDQLLVEEELAELLDDESLRRRMGAAARQRAVAEFTYDALATRLGEAIDRTITDLAGGSTSGDGRTGAEPVRVDPS